MDARLARVLWHQVETINAVTYFSPECRDAPDRLGLKGFWMGYFACRAAPLGPVSQTVVEAIFYNFHPDRVRRALPEAWALARPEEVVVARASAAATALRRLLGAEAVEKLAEQVLPAARDAISRAEPAGRPLFAANRDVRPSDDPVSDLWQAATTLREHRGDGHVALLASSGLDGCEAHVLFVADVGGSSELYRQSRGWSEAEWSDAEARLGARGLLTPDGASTDAGRALRADIERRTDELAVAAFVGLGEQRVTHLIHVLEPARRRISASGEVPFPNPMGLPPPAQGQT